MTETQLVDLFVDQQRSHHTRRAYRSDMERWHRFLAGRQPDEHIVLQFRLMLEQTLAPASAARAYSTVRSYYAFRQRYDGSPNPFVLVRAPRRPQRTVPKSPDALDVDRVLSLIHDDEDPVGALRHKAVICLLLNGLRAEEVSNLNEDDLYYDSSLDCWWLRVIGKGSKERLVPATTETVEAVQAYRVHKPYPVLVGTARGQRLSLKQVEYAVAKWAHKAKVKGFHPHALRHNYATRMNNAGANLFVLQRLMGHANADTTAIYVRVDMRDLAAAARLDPRNQKETADRDHPRLPHPERT